MTLFTALENSTLVRPVDLELARCLRRLDVHTADAVLAGAALASFALSKGHSGLKLDCAWQLLERELNVALPTVPDWQQQLTASRWVASPENSHQPSDRRCPLVLEYGLLYLRRYREYERQLVTDLIRIGGATSPSSTDTAQRNRLFARLFPDGSTGDAQQTRAALLAMNCPLLLLTGGPGTGKTTTIARLLLLMLAWAKQQGAPTPRIRLAAPTGKAAERMASSLRAGVQQCLAAGMDPAVCASLPTGAETVHRLLGTILDSPRFRHHAAHRLAADVIVLDETSMLDLPLMSKLLAAIPGRDDPHPCQLVLVGDPDQLPSVDTGDVLNTLVKACTADAPIPVRRVHLQRGWRQQEVLQLAPLAQAVQGSADPLQREHALRLLREGSLSNVVLHTNLHDPLEPASTPLLAHWRALMEASTPKAALAGMNRLRILTAVRDGAYGARQINARMDALLRTRLPAHKRHSLRQPLHGQPLIITENDYRHGLFNGDIGIIQPDPATPRGPLLAWFPDETGDAPRAFHLASLPAHEPAFALTVHKAQGSEFDSVWLLLPNTPGRIITRELIYTAITRARHELHIVSRENSLRSALTNSVTRWSGLAARLGA